MPKLDETRKAAWRMLLMARARLVEKIDRELTAANVVSFDWYDVLLWLEEAGGKLKMGELADQVLTSRSGLTRLVDRIEAAGYIKREHCAQDRRVVYAVLTDAGLAARVEAWTIYEPALIQHFARFLSETDAATMRDALARTLEDNAPEQK
jgi:DNA-binding MarR family transcriptional regulator